MAKQLTHPFLNRLEAYQLSLLVTQLDCEGCYLEPPQTQFEFPFFSVRRKEDDQKVGALEFNPSTRDWYLQSDEEYWGEDIDRLISCILYWVEDEEDIPATITVAKDDTDDTGKMHSLDGHNRLAGIIEVAKHLQQQSKEKEE
ncbi:MAG TPA: hypothetical protein VIQ31_38530 [Phormidium sp.]